MAQGGTSEATYERLKTALLSGIIEAHAKLDIVQLAENFGVSPTPVREAAMRLLGEGLLELHPRGGTQPLLISELRLRSMLELHGRLLVLALGWAPPAHLSRYAPALTGDVAGDSRALFTAIIHAPENFDLMKLFDHLADRLAAFRMVEHHVFADVSTELQEIRALLVSCSPAPLRKSLRRYHQRRIAQAAQLAWLTARISVPSPSH